ncbi:MAG: hypothetical protein GEU28_05800 [Dehalococcoidia bacterium]|nr:hypothetical protein [Dehalococcoidia bacterium]
MTPTWRGDDRFLVFRMDNIAQTIMAMPAIRAMRTTLPESRITLMTSQGAADLGPCLYGVSDIVPFTSAWSDARKEMPFDPDREKAMIEEIKDGKFDAAIVLTNQAQSPLPAAYAAYMAGIRLRLGRSAEVPGSLLTTRLRGFGQGHEVERCLEVVAAWGFAGTGSTRGVLQTPEKVAASAAKLLENHEVAGRPYAVIHAGADSRGKEVGPDAFARVMVELSTRFGFLPVLTGLPHERLAAEWVAGEAGTPALVLAGETSIPELAAVVEGARVVVSANLSPLHVASAFGVPSLLVHDESKPPASWLPLGRTACIDSSKGDAAEVLIALLEADEGSMASAAQTCAPVGSGAGAGEMAAI